MQARIKMLKTSNGVNSVVSIAKTLMANYTLEFDTKEDLFGCENGVIDIAEECFRYYHFDDYITWTCRYDFSPNLHTGFKVQIGEEELECWLGRDTMVLTVTGGRRQKSEETYISTRDGNRYFPRK